MEINPEFSFPSSNATFSKGKTRATSMSGAAERPSRKHIHAHRRSAAVSEDLSNMDLSKLVAEAAAKPPATPSWGPSPNFRHSKTPSFGGEPANMSPRKVAFVDPPSPAPPARTSRSPTQSPVRPTARSLGDIPRLNEVPALTGLSMSPRGSPRGSPTGSPSPRGSPTAHQRSKSVSPSRTLSRRSTEISESDGNSAVSDATTKSSRRRSFVNLFTRKRQSKSISSPAGAGMPVEQAPVSQGRRSNDSGTSTASPGSYSEAGASPSYSDVKMYLPEPPSIDLDAALSPSFGALSMHRRSESVPAVLKSPFSGFSSVPRPITPVVEEEEDADTSRSTTDSNDPDRHWGREPMSRGSSMFPTQVLQQPVQFGFSTPNSASVTSLSILDAASQSSFYSVSPEIVGSAPATPQVGKFVLGEPGSAEVYVEKTAPKQPQAQPQRGARRALLDWVRGRPRPRKEVDR